jgi:hypothetical protein
VLTGGASYEGYVVNTLSGDASPMSGTATASDDLLRGGDAFGAGGPAYSANHPIGDAELVYSSARGGNDVLVGGDKHGQGTTWNDMYGDFLSVGSGQPTGGNDRLVAGTAEGAGAVFNQMWGDVFGPWDSGGSNTFVFRDTVNATVGRTPKSGTSARVITIKSGLSQGVRSFGDLTINYDLFETATIHAGADVMSLTHFAGQLVASDFI